MPHMPMGPEGANIVNIAQTIATLDDVKYLLGVKAVKLTREYKTE